MYYYYDDIAMMRCAAYAEQMPKPWPDLDQFKIGQMNGVNNGNGNRNGIN